MNELKEEYVVDRVWVNLKIKNYSITLVYYQYTLKSSIIFVEPPNNLWTDDNQRIKQTEGEKN